jgi:nitrite reductase (NO-forming)
MAGQATRRAAGRARLGATFAGLALVVAACGSGAATPGVSFSPASQPPASAAPSASTEPPSGSGATVTLSLKEYSITPATVTVTAGTPVTFEVRNDGTINHALVISGTGVNLATKDLSFGPGTTETISATLAAGTYTFICPVDGHAGQGMTGTITVTP